MNFNRWDAFLFLLEDNKWFHVNIENRKYVSDLEEEEETSLERNINTLLNFYGNTPNAAFHWNKKLFFPLLERPGTKYEKFREFVMCLKTLVKVEDYESRNLIQFDVKKIPKKIGFISLHAKYKSMAMEKYYQYADSFNEVHEFMNVCFVDDCSRGRIGY